MASAQHYRTNNGRLFMARWTGVDGRVKRKRGFTNRRAALMHAHMMQRRSDEIAAGFRTEGDFKRVEHGNRPIQQHVEEFIEATQVEHHEQHRREIRSGIEKTIKELSWRNITDIEFNQVQGYLAKLTKSGMSAATVNRRRAYLKSFTKWLATGGKRLATDPLYKLPKFNEDQDRRYVRAIFERKEIDRILKVAPLHRAMCYRLMYGTGLRVSEVRRLFPTSFAWTGPDAPSVTFLGKAGVHQTQPIPRELETILRPWIESRPVGEPIWRIPDDTTYWLKYDMKEAGVPRRVGSQVRDFHSLRHSYVTELVRSNLHPKDVQTLARHTTMELTMKFYTHRFTGEIREQLERAPVARLEITGNVAQMKKAVGAESMGGDEKDPPQDDGPQSLTKQWAGKDSNLRRHKPSDLQSGDTAARKACQHSDFTPEGQNRAPTGAPESCGESNSLHRMPLRGAERRNPQGIGNPRRTARKTAAASLRLVRSGKRGGA